MKTGTINLSELRVIQGAVPLKGVTSVQLLSANLSGSTTFNLQFSNDKISWANAKESGADVTGTLISGAVIFEAFSGIPGSYYQIIFAGATTGNISYVKNPL